MIVGDIFEVFCYISEGICCIGGVSECIDFVISLCLDFRFGCFDMCFFVGGVIELICLNCIVEFFCMFFCLVVVVFWVIECNGGDGIDFSVEKV